MGEEVIEQGIFTAHISGRVEISGFEVTFFCAASKLINAYNLYICF